MKILVCVKQILAPESDLAPSGDGTAVVPQGSVERRISRYDACALEAALQLRERIGGRVQVVTVGPADAADALRRALGMGADEALHIACADELIDPFTVARAVAPAAQDSDLVLAGVMSEDLMQGAMGPILAALLGRPCATAALALEPAPDGSGLRVEEELEHGERGVVTLALPAVVTIQSGPWTPRYPSLSGLLKARRQAIETFALAVQEPRLRMAGLASPSPTRRGRILSGSAGEKAAQLVHLLRQQGFLPPGHP
ncbi:MAG: electron transfer flavoprotein subunit beta/FixA family protein [Desulfobacterales bacterium]|jgi:electron transfer flavoprotein beta subunit|nr:electron transfer flavoprotein subunit beta/FixA family protein [Desulfobacterales bacterium]